METEEFMQMSFGPDGKTGTPKKKKYKKVRGGVNGDCGGGGGCKAPTSMTVIRKKLKKTGPPQSPPEKKQTGYENPRFMSGSQNSNPGSDFGGINTNSSEGERKRSRFLRKNPLR